jgi:hypothetical protein
VLTYSVGVIKSLQSRFKPTEQSQNLNLLDIKVAEMTALKKHAGLLNTPVEKLSQKERNKVARLNEARMLSEPNLPSQDPKKPGLIYHDGQPATVNSLPKHQQRITVQKKPNPRPQEDLVLVIALEPSLFHTAPKLQYVYTPRPAVPSGLHMADLKKKYQLFLTELRHKLSLTEKYRYFYTKLGIPVESIAEVIRGDYTFFISCLPTFEGSGEKSLTYRTLMETKFCSAVCVWLTKDFTTRVCIDRDHQS